MDAVIVAGALALGLAGAPHCTAMCAAPCAAIIGREGPSAMALPAFHAARAAGYALAGAVVAGGVAGLGALAQVAPALRPLWALVHAALMLLGLVLLWQGRQPAWLAQRLAWPARSGPLALSAAVAGASTGSAWQPVHGPRPPGARQGAPARAAAAGSLWVAWPCGLLQSALLMAALSSSAIGGAVAMVAFAAASSLGLVLAPLAWRWLGQRAAGARLESLAVRLAGAVMAGFSGWALTSGVWHRVAEYCATL